MRQSEDVQHDGWEADELGRATYRAWLSKVPQVVSDTITLLNEAEPAVILVPSPSSRRSEQRVALAAMGRPLRAANPTSEGFTGGAAIQVTRTLTTEKRASEFLTARGGGWYRELQQTLAHVRALSCKIDVSIQVGGRVKSVASILHKMASGTLGAHEVFDIIGVRAITRDTRDCYRLVSLIHEELFSLHTEYDDYVVAPKASGYRALHTTVVGRSGLPAEIQVRADWMNKLAEQGPAAHSCYKRRQYANWNR